MGLLAHKLVSFILVYESLDQRSRLSLLLHEDPKLEDGAAQGSHRMLKWASAFMMMQAEARQTNTACNQKDSTVGQLPGIAFTRSSHQPIVLDQAWGEHLHASYGLGWFRQTIPSHWLGLISSNFLLLLDPPVIGECGPPRLAVSHHGTFGGFGCAFYTFPETCSDPTDLIAQERLRSRIPLMKEILQTTRQPRDVHWSHLRWRGSHEGKLRCLGHRDWPEARQRYTVLHRVPLQGLHDCFSRPPCPRGQISWDSTIQSILPEFNHVQSPLLSANLTLRDTCSHRNGLLSMDDITQGLDARILLPKKDVVRISNSLPIKHDLRTRFLYNNALFELAGHVVERVAGVSNWGEFQ